VRRPQSGAAPPVQAVTPSPHSAAWLLSRQDEELKEEQRLLLLTKLFEVCPEAQTAQSLVQRFQQIATGRRAADFDVWLRDVAKSKLPEIASFAFTLGKDRAVARR